jgi:DNA modification methylase
MEKRLHDLRQEEHGVGKRGKKVGWSLRDTAEELEMSFGVLSEDIRLAEAILADPNLKKVGDKTTARRVILRSLKRVEQEVSAGTTVNFECNVVHLGSSEIVLQAYPDNTFDACITDPPWTEFKDKTLTRDESTLLVFEQVFRVLKRNAFLYAFVGLDDFMMYREELSKFGFNVQKYPNIWVKTGTLSRGCRAWEYQRDYEFIVVAVKGSPALSGSILSAVITCAAVPASKLIHPNEKPETVISTLMEHCTYEGSMVLDPFAGSGVVPFVAKRMGRRYIAVERNPEFYTKIAERLRGEDNESRTVA